MESNGIQMLRCAATSVAGQHLPKQHESKNPLHDHRQQIKESSWTPRSVYYLNAYNQYEWHDGSWDELKSISILDAIHVYGWDPHMGDMYSKFYIRISSQPMMRLGISSNNVAALWSLWDSVICLDQRSVRHWIIVLVHWMYWRTMRSTLWNIVFTLRSALIIP